MASHSLNYFRLHAGYGFQRDANSVLLGIDRTFELFQRATVLRADLVQTNGGADWMPSVGILHGLNSWSVLEAWASQTMADGQSPWFMLKLNLIPSNF
jgi:hypothetical protein